MANSRWRPSPDAIRSALVALVALAAFFVVLSAVRAGYPTSAPAAAAAARPDFIQQPQQAAQYVERLALRSHGDYGRLSAEDRDYLDHVTKGHGPQMLRMIVRYHGQGSGAHRLRP